MVALQDRPQQLKASLPYLKPIAKPTKRSPRWLGVAFGIAQVGAIALGVWLSAKPLPTTKAASPLSIEQAIAQQPFAQLATDDYAEFVIDYQQEKAAVLLAEAEVHEQQAEQRNLLAEYALADGMLPYSPGQAIKTTTRVEVVCDENELGSIAIVKQLNHTYKGGRIGPLQSCNAGTLGPGDVIGVAGKHQASIRDD